MKRMQKEKLRLSMFAPIDRETPIIEVLFEHKVLLDLSYKNDDPSKEIEVLFHDDIAGACFGVSKLIDLVEEGKKRLLEE